MFICQNHPFLLTPETSDLHCPASLQPGVKTLDVLKCDSMTAGSSLFLPLPSAPPHATWLYPNTAPRLSRDVCICSRSTLAWGAAVSLPSPRLSVPVPGLHCSSFSGSVYFLFFSLLLGYCWQISEDFEGKCWHLQTSWGSQASAFLLYKDQTNQGAGGHNFLLQYLSSFFF